MKHRSTTVAAFALALAIVAPPLYARESAAPVTRYAAPRDHLAPPSLNTVGPVDTFVLGRYPFTFGDQGWVGVDLTAQLDTFFHVDDFDGLAGGDFGRLTPIAGNQSLWCGAAPGAMTVCNYSSLPGYGNEWGQYFESTTFTTNGSVTVSFLTRYDTEAGYDAAYLEYKNNSGDWVLLDTFDGLGGDPSPALIGGYNTPFIARGIALEGDLAYVADSDSGLYIIDISDPTAPVRVGWAGMPDAAIGVAVSGNFAYVAAEDSGLQVVDISNPASPSPAGSLPLPGQASGIAISDSIALVAANTAGLHVVDISSPGSPVLLGSYDVPLFNYSIDVAVKDTLAFLPVASAGGETPTLDIISIATPSNPQLIGTYASPGQPFGVDVAGAYVYLADDGGVGGGLKIIDVSNPAAPVLTDSLDTPGEAIDVTVAGGHVFVADGTNGLTIYELVAPGDAEFSSNMNLSNTKEIAIRNDLALLADGTGGLRVIRWDNPPELITHTIDGSELGGQIQLRFRFESDESWSDEDGLNDTDGAIVIDSLLVQDEGGTVDFQDFESEAVGALSTNDGNWHARPAPGFGNFAAIHSGSNVVQMDPCRDNPDNLWGFFDHKDSTDFGCGGFTSQGAVPYGPDANGLYLDNEIWSPPIDLSQDIDGVSVPVTASRTFLEFSVYADLPVDALITYGFRVRSLVGGCWTPWRDDGELFFGPDGRWERHRFEITHLIDDGATDIMVALRCKDVCPTECGILGDGTCHGPAPLFDGVTVYRTDALGPSWFVQAECLFQDDFPADGTVTGNVRADAGIDIAGAATAMIRPGDSLAVTVREPNYGIASHASGGPAVYGHVLVLPAGQPGKSGPDLAAIDTDPSVGLRFPLVDSVTHDGAWWYRFRLDSVRTNGTAMADRYCWDLNDNVFDPGDTILYYVSAVDSVGRTTSWSAHAGVALGEGARLHPMEFTALPANALTGQTKILFVEDSDGESREHFDSTFDLLGVRPDRYDVGGAAAAAGNGPGARVRDVGQQIIPFYDVIIWSSGSLRTGLIGDGPGSADKSPDYDFLATFADQHPAGPGLYISGANIAEEWASLSAGASAGATALGAYLGFGVVSSDHSLVESLSPLAISLPGSCFDDAAGPDTLIAYGGCPLLNDFDVLQPAGTAAVEMAFSGNPAHGAIVSQITPNAAGDTARVMLSGFGFHDVRDDVATDPLDRVEHLSDILTWLKQGVGIPTAVPAALGPADRLAQNYPNPFNPTTTIRYSIRTQRHVRLDVYDVTGALVTRLVDEVQRPRPKGYSVSWSGENSAGNAVASGIYFYRLQAGEFVRTRKMVLLK